MSTTVVAACLPTLQRCGLLTAAELGGVEWLLEREAPFAAVVDAAESLHVHVKVDDTAQLPVGEFLDAGAVLDHRKDGYVKFRFPDGINAIFSHIRIAQEEAAVDDAVRRPRPYLDHVGVDLREETVPVRAVFDAVPDIGARFGWTNVAQGGDRPVYCCHVSVERKHWLYPTCGALNGIPIEFAFGRLVTDTGKTGCDLRPAMPGSAAAGCDPATGCC